MFLLFMSGASLGSFAYCAAIRIVRKEDWTRGRSHCDACGHTLSFFDLIPVFSYMFLKGRCRYCHARIPLSSLLSEVTGGILSVLLYICMY